MFYCLKSKKEMRLWKMIGQIKSIKMIKNKVKFKT